MIRTGRVRLSILKVNGRMEDSGCCFEASNTRLVVHHTLERSFWILKICIKDWKSNEKCVVCFVFRIDEKSWCSLRGNIAFGCTSWEQLILLHSEWADKSTYSQYDAANRCDTRLFQQQHLALFLQHLVPWFILKLRATKVPDHHPHCQRQRASRHDSRSEAWHHLCQTIDSTRLPRHFRLHVVIWPLFCSNLFSKRQYWWLFL